MIEHEANGSFITDQLVGYVRNQLTAKEKTATHHLTMTKSQWEKIVRMYHEVTGVVFNTFEFAGVPVTLERAMPESEIRFCKKDNTVVGKIVGLER